MSKGTWKERPDGPPEYPSRRPLGDALERHALAALDRAMKLEELAARERSDAIRLGRLATRFGGVPPLRLLPMARPDHDEAA